MTESALEKDNKLAGQRDLQNLCYRLAENGVGFITIDVKDRPVNVLTPELHREIGIAAEMVAAESNCIGAVIHSGKSSFMAGGDLNRLVGYFEANRTPEEAYSQSLTYTQSLRRLETCGKPVAVAINGNALGGGLELALACHYRVVADDKKILLGLPEVSLGLIPGGGGTQRLPRLIGLKQACSLILWSKYLSPEKALELGIVQQVAPAADLVSQAEQWILKGGEAQQPWDRKGFRFPGGSGLNDMNIGRLFQQLTGRISADFRHNYPAPIAALRCLFNGSTVSSMDVALKIEAREFSALTRDPVARNMIRTLFINRGKLSRQQVMSESGAEALKKQCLEAYIQQGLDMVFEGVGAVLIENAAFAAGMVQGPLVLAEHSMENFASGDSALDWATVKDRLLFVQVLVAAECWQRGEIDPITADLASVLGWDFPSYSGGVMSFIDTMGFSAFIERCDQLAEKFGDVFKVTPALRKRAAAGDRIYPPLS